MDRLGHNADEITVVIADDKEMERTGLTVHVGKSPGFRCLAETGVRSAILPLVQLHQPNLLILDLSWPNDDLAGVNICAQVKATVPAVHVLLLTHYRDLMAQLGSSHLADALDEKPSSRPALVEMMLTACGRLDVPAPIESRSKSLTMTEVEVLRLLSHGLTNQQIAAHRQRSVHVIGDHIKSIYAKLEVDNRVSAVNEGRRLGLIMS